MSAIYVKLHKNADNRNNSDGRINKIHRTFWSQLLCTFWSQLLFFFLIVAFLKFLKVKCNPTNKISWPKRDRKNNYNTSDIRWTIHDCIDSGGVSEHNFPTKCQSWTFPLLVTTFQNGVQCGLLLIFLKEISGFSVFVFFWIFGFLFYFLCT